MVAPEVHAGGIDGVFDIFGALPPDGSLLPTLPASLVKLDVVIHPFGDRDAEILA